MNPNNLHIVLSDDEWPQLVQLGIGLVGQIVRPEHAEYIKASCNEYDQLMADNAALRAQIAAKDEIANQVLNDALKMKDPVREQLVDALMRALPFVEECQDSTHFKDDYVKARVDQIRAALKAARAA